ncbi:hypothetical protein BTHI11S_00653 [Bosea thiooxidans]
MLKVDDVLEILSIPLLGRVPESMDVLRASNVGSPVTLADERSAPAVAYFEAARRLRGEALPVAVPGEKRGFFGKFFGRKAASCFVFSPAPSRLPPRASDCRCSLPMSAPPSAISDLVTKLRDEILRAISKHMQVDDEKVSVRMERGAKVSTLAVDIEIPFDAGKKAA